MYDLPEQGIRLRGFEGDKDLDQLMLMENDREVASLMSGRFIVPQGEKTREEWKRGIEDQTEMFCIIETIPDSEKQEKAEFIGFVGLYAPQRDRVLRQSSYVIGLVKKFWDNGYGTAVTRFMVDYAFRHLFMHRIGLGVFDGNDRAVAVYQKCGFVLEGRDRKVHWEDGGWKDLIRMGIIIDDWVEMQKKSA